MLLAGCFLSAHAIEVQLVRATVLVCSSFPGLTEKQNQQADNQEQCSGMYSRKSWGGSVDPFIDVVFSPYSAPLGQDGIEDPTIAFMIFEWQDESLIGVPDRDNELDVCGRTFE
jgi:hypothetical protein